MALSKKDKLRYCLGCEDDFYNGKNPYGVKECWNLEDAKVEWKKEVHVDERPPWEQKARRFLNCYRKKRFAYVKPNRKN